MRTQDASETYSWLERHNLRCLPGGDGADGHVFEAETGHFLKFTIPAAANRQILLAHGLAEMLSESETLLWITYVGLEEEEIEFFKAWRKDHDEYRHMPEAPGYLFDLTNEHDRWKLTEAMFILTALNWTGFVIQPSGPDIIWLADEIIDLVVQDVGLFSRIGDLLNQLCIEFTVME